MNLALCRIFGHKWFRVNLPWESRDCCERCGVCRDEAAGQSPPLVPSAICHTIGHSMDPMESSYIGCACFRCGETFLSEAPRDDLWFWLSWYNFKGEFLARLRWLRKLRRDDQEMPF